MIKVPRQFRRRFYEFIGSKFPREYKFCDKEVAILVPLAKKDLAVAEFSIPSLRANIKHKIVRFLIVGQDCEEIHDFCKRHEIEFLSENEVLKPYLSHELVQQKGWIKQQIIKITAFDYIDCERILAFDSDTMLLRGINYFDELPNFYLADEYTKKYMYFIEKILGIKTRAPRSFVAHSMMFERDKMAALNTHCEKLHGTNWVGALLKYADLENYTKFSEYEIYGNFIYHFFKGQFKTRYWFNIKNRKFEFTDVENIRVFYKDFNSVSMHIHDT